MNKMKHYRRFLLLLSATTSGFAGFSRQVMLTDSITKNPVIYTTVYDVNGEVVLGLGHCEVVEHADDLSGSGVVRTKTIGEVVYNNK